MRCTRCDSEKATVYINDDILCDSCANRYDNCTKCGGLVHDNERDPWGVCDNCRGGV